MKLAGTTALVTGASGGIGAEIARELARAGARVALSGRRAERLEAVCSGLEGSGHRTHAADLTRPEAPEELVRDAGEVDVFVSTAGLPASGWLEDYRSDQLARAVRVNLEAPMQIALLLAPRLTRAGEGHLSFVSSLAGKIPSPGLSIYCATKFGLRGFALALHSELAPRGVGVSVISPGFVREVGMFAESGAELPPGTGSSSAADVALAVRRAIEGGAPEIVVAPRRHRLIAHFALALPRPWMRAVTGETSLRTARAIAEGQVDRR